MCEEHSAVHTCRRRLLRLSSFRPRFGHLPSCAQNYLFSVALSTFSASASIVFQITQKCLLVGGSLLAMSYYLGFRLWLPHWRGSNLQHVPAHSRAWNSGQSTKLLLFILLDLKASVGAGAPNTPYPLSGEQRLGIYLNFKIPELDLSFYLDSYFCSCCPISCLHIYMRHQFCLCVLILPTKKGG